MRLLVCFLAFMSGCASFSTGKVPLTTKEEYLAIKAKRITFKPTNVVRVENKGKSYTYSYDERIQSFGLFNAEDSKKTVDSHCKEGTCKDVPVDIQIFADVSKELVTEPKKIALDVALFMLTFGLYPASEEYQYKVNAVALDQDKKIIGTYHYEDKVKTYFQLFLLFARPFLDTQDESKTYGNLVLKTVISADNDSQKTHTTSLK